MLPFKFNIPYLSPDHWEQVRKIAEQTIKNSLSDEMRKAYKKIIPDLEPENSFGMVGISVGDSQKTFFSPFLYHADKLPEDIRDFLWGCYLGSHEYYCKEHGLLNEK